MDMILYVCGAIMTICGTITTAVSIIKLAKTPKDQLDGRLKKIEEKLLEHDVLLNNDNNRIKVIEEGNRVTQKALLALLAHGIDGNSIDAMTDARDELQKYLINR